MKKISEIMSSNPSIVHPDDTLEKVYNILSTKRFAALPVVANDDIVGIITWYDLRKYVFHEYDQTKVEEAMSRNPLIIPEDTPIDDAKRIMDEERVGSLLIGENKRLIGIVTRADIKRFENMNYKVGEPVSRPENRWVVGAIVGCLVSLLLIGGVTWGIVWLINTLTDNQEREVEHQAQVKKEQQCDNNFCVYEGVNPPYSPSLSGYGRVEFINNKEARDTTWAELKAFISQDQTDKIPYTLSFRCGSYAERIHNNAEAGGIKAAFVVVRFTDGEYHALNTFNTVDQGPVYVECTGEGLLQPRVMLREGWTMYGETSSWDKAAYVEIGKKLGIISLEVASCPSYVCYEQWQQKLQEFRNTQEDYNRDVMAHEVEVRNYSQWLSGRIIYEGTPDASKAYQWYNANESRRRELEARKTELDRMARSLGAFWNPMGTVERVEIYW